MNRAIAALTVFVVGLILGCENPPRFEPVVPGLEGDYHGTYSYMFNPGGGPDTMLQAVHVSFGAAGFSMHADTTSPQYDPSVCFCLAYGRYAITDRILLTDTTVTSLPDNCGGCNAEWGPSGVYTLEQPPATFILTCIDSAGPEWITRQLVLTKLGDI